MSRGDGPLRARPRPEGPERVASLRSRAVVVALALLVAASSACVPLFIPPLPTDRLEFEPAFRLHGDARLEFVDDAEHRLVLIMRAAEVPRPGWLVVQWFGPSGPARAAESVWFDGDSLDVEVRLDTPPGLDVTPGEWRAVLSWDGRLVRQLRIDLE